ncbi:TolC family protein [Ammonifex thiophilus]|uniref:TolC family protein n=1 Tax=Ammonifex thiophilus TaxID=444093 RepID=A0A3D8P6R2_9THEO|nr:TolC family protein [Ammonifex thiophilus]RDV84542.1 TolC family protein [Ammonifex thiophilus]
MRRWRLTALGTLLLLVSSLLAPFLAWGAESSQMSLSLAEAVQLAWQNSPDIRAAQAEVDKWWEQRKDAADVVEKMSYIPAAGPNVVPYADMAWVALLSTDAAWQMAKKNLEDKKQYLAVQVAQAYYDVLAAQTAYEQAKRQLELAERALSVARAAYWAGTATNFDLAKPEADAQAASKGLAAAKEALGKAYVVLNRLIGLPSDSRPVLTTRPPTENLKVESLDAEVSRALESSASIFALRKNVDIARWNVDYPYATGKYLKYNIATADLAASEQQLYAAQDVLKEKVHTTYRQIRSLEEQIQAQEAQVKAAEEAARLAKIRYEAGVAIKLEVDKAETALAEARAKLENLYCQHAAALAGWNYLTGRPVVNGT